MRSHRCLCSSVSAGHIARSYALAPFGARLNLGTDRHKKASKSPGSYCLLLPP